MCLFLIRVDGVHSLFCVGKRHIRLFQLRVSSMEELGVMYLGKYVGSS